MMDELNSVADKLLSPKLANNELNGSCNKVAAAGIGAMDTLFPSMLPDQDYLKQFLQSISAASSVSSPQPPHLTTFSATPSEMGDTQSHTNSGNASPRIDDVSQASAPATGVNTPIPGHVESMPSASAAHAALRLLSVITSVQSGQGAQGALNAAFKLPIPMDDATESQSNSQLAAALAAVMAAAQGQQAATVAPPVLGFNDQISHDDVQRPKSDSDDLSKSIRELEFEDTLLVRLEREYTEEKRELVNYESKVSNLDRDIDRYVEQIEDMELALMSKRELLTKATLEKKEVDDMMSFLKNRLETKDDMIKEKAAKIESLKHLLPRDSDVLKRLKNRERDRHFERERDRQRDSSSTLGKRVRDPSPVKSVPKYASNACYGYNSMGVCRRQNCMSDHVCLLCGRKHPMTHCDSDRAICVKFNMDECEGTCYRDHRCLRCASKDHRLVDCPIPHTPGVEYCFAWNSSNAVCKQPGCFRKHQCMRCQGPHSVVCCPDNIDVYWGEAKTVESRRRWTSDSSGSTFDDDRQDTKKSKQEDTSRHRISDKERRQVCRDWNNGRCSANRDKCKFKHLCLKCGDSAHPEKQCPFAAPRR